jgi:hypothetical protein
LLDWPVEYVKEKRLWILVEKKKVECISFHASLEKP